MALCSVPGPPLVAAPAFGININPMMLVRRDTTTMHKLVYVAESFAALASLGADGYSTEVAVIQTPAWLRKHGYQCNPCITEANPLFAHSVNGVQEFSQAKFWTYKAFLAATPFISTWAIHKAHKDDVHSDVASIISASAATALFTSIAFHNLHLAADIKAQNVLARASP
jgi:hypothetical protein